MAFLSSIAMAVAFLVTGTPAIVNAAPTTDPAVTLHDVQMTRTISDTQLSPGEVFTVRYDFANTTGPDRYLHYFQDKPPTGVTFLGMDYDAALGSPTRVWRSGPLLGGWNDPAPWAGYPAQPAASPGSVMVRWDDKGTCAGSACDTALVQPNGVKVPTLVFRYQVDANTVPGPVLWNSYTYVETRGGGDYSGVPGAVSFVKADTQTSTVLATPNPATTGVATTLSATVTGGTPGVGVEFRNGSTVLCTGTVATGGSVSCPWTPTVSGAASVTAHYLGTANTNISASPSATSVAVQQGVVAPPSGLQVTPTTPTVDDPVTVSGTASPGAAVTVTGPGGSSCTAIAGPGGTFSCSLGTLPVGDHTITAVATLNGVSSDPASLAVTVGPDSTPPAPPANILAAPQPANHGATVTITGEAEPNSTVTVMVGGVEVCEVRASAAGAFSCSVTAQEGMNGQPITAIATDANGNASQPGAGGNFSVAAAQPPVTVTMTTTQTSVTTAVTTAVTTETTTEVPTTVTDTTTATVTETTEVPTTVTETSEVPTTVTATTTELVPTTVTETTEVLTTVTESTTATATTTELVPTTTTELVPTTVTESTTATATTTEVVPTTTTELVPTTATTTATTTELVPTTATTTATTTELVPTTTTELVPTTVTESTTATETTTELVPTTATTTATTTELVPTTTTELVPTTATESTTATATTTELVPTTVIETTTTTADPGTVTVTVTDTSVSTTTSTQLETTTETETSSATTTVVSTTTTTETTTAVPDTGSIGGGSLGDNGGANVIGDLFEAIFGSLGSSAASLGSVGEDTGGESGSLDSGVLGSLAEIVGSSGDADGGGSLGSTEDGPLGSLGSDWLSPGSLGVLTASSEFGSGADPGSGALGSVGDAGSVALGSLGLAAVAAGGVIYAINSGAIRLEDMALPPLPREVAALLGLDQQADREVAPPAPGPFIQNGRG